MKAFLKNYRQTPRKVRLVARALKGKRVVDALTLLSFLDKRAAEPLAKLIKSAVANAKGAGVAKDALVIKNIEVDKGFAFKRFQPRARGSASPIRKFTSRIAVTLEKK